ncbi:hypothetical protein [Lichenifustis flavocetrariae]|uniref:Uncharacterized protein n=1 Tax=Lichenifustis flavocetrariae TaxID=2949735 RepID=A0AA41YYK8_9HYPH|nr:hypothetical protein [Lichenifustis flavocetrariae]MCW6510494.1 hypothetical protein [Lichenifustis flavocetrariae]
MRIHLAAFTLAFLAAGLSAAPAADYSGPVRHHRHYSAFGRASVGECVRTRVETIGTVPGSSASPVIRYRDGVIQDFDGGMLGQTETRPGDPIQLCLVSFTRDCGTVFENELPGRTYATGNLRTGAAWTSPDIRSSCAVR